MMKTPSLSSPLEHNSSPKQPLELAFCVAALQNGTGGDQHDVTTTIAPSAAVAPQRTTQPAGSGSQEVQVPGPSDTHDDDDDDDDDETLELRLAKSRERNREHARRTRLRKKAQMESLQQKVKCLEAERQVLRQRMEDCSTASILLGFSSGGESSSNHLAVVSQQQQLLLDSVAAATTTTTAIDTTAAADETATTKTTTTASGTASTTHARLTAHRRKLFLLASSSSQQQPQQQQPQSLTVSLDGETLTVVTGGCHISWKTGVFHDPITGKRQKLTPHQLEKLRRERNRMHAKLTRDRKKCFLHDLEETIEKMQAECDQLKRVLAQVAHPTAAPAVTPIASPLLGSAVEENNNNNNNTNNNSTVVADKTSHKRVKVTHGFSLND